MILDLEDAVTTANKDYARALVKRVLAGIEVSATVSVRVNALSTPWAEDDLSMCADTAGIHSVVIPKVDTAQDLEYVGRILTGCDLRIQALIETPLGVREADGIAWSTDRLDTLIIGYADLGAALGRSRTANPQQWLPIQDRILVAARAAGITAIDGPNLSINDDNQFEQSCVWTRQLGFDGKWVIHPAQIDTATRVFTPSDTEIAEARKVLTALEDAEARGNGAAQLDGQMLDEAVAVAARRVLAQVAG